MQSAFPSAIHPAARPRRQPFLIVALMLGLMLTVTPTVTAQEATPAPGATPAATPEAAATPESAGANTLGNVLMSYNFDTLPQAPLTVRLLRITLAPGASSPMHTHPGPEFDLVESGTLTAQVDGTAVLNADGEQSEVTEPQTVTSGSWIMYPAGTGMSLSNEGSEDLVMLSAVLHPVGAGAGSTITYEGGQPDPSAFDGVSYVVLGDGLIQQFPQGGAAVTIDTLTVEAGEPIPSWSGPALLSKSAGELAIASEEGVVQVTRTADPGLKANAVPGQEFELEDNDAAFFPSGYETIARPDSDSALTLYRLLIAPNGELANAPAVITTIQPQQTGDGTNASAGENSGIGVGAIIALSEDAVRIRAEATTNSDIIDSFPAGTQFELLEGPVAGEDFTWYRVRGVGDLSDVEGWMVTAFMDVIEPAPADAQQETGETEANEEATLPAAPTTPEAGTPVSTPEPTGEIGAGAIVATTEDNLRIREEPSLGTDILRALPEGTQLEVIGGPEEAEEYTWYQVQVVDGDLSGWTVADYLVVVEPAGE